MLSPHRLRYRAIVGATPSRSHARRWREHLLQASHGFSASAVPRFFAAISLSIALSSVASLAASSAYRSRSRAAAANLSRPPQGCPTWPSTRQLALFHPCATANVSRPNTRLLILNGHFAWPALLYSACFRSRAGLHPKLKGTARVNVAEARQAEISRFGKAGARQRRLPSLLKEVSGIVRCRRRQRDES